MSVSRRMLMAAAGQVSESYDDLVLSTNPVGYWPLQESEGTTATDLSGNSDGTYTGGVVLGQPSLLAGKPGLTSVRFGGAGGASKMSAPYVAAWNFDATGEFTVEGWFIFDVARNFNTVWQNGTGNGVHAFDVYVNSSMAIQVVVDFGSGITDTVPLDQVVYLALMRRGGNYRWFRNGVQVDLGSTAGVNSNGNPLQVGGRDDGATQLDGRASHVALHDYGLTDQDILDRWNLGSGA